jgi:hypothetical protein
MTGAIGALKCLAQLEPDLIMPAALERAIPSLQGLEEVRLRSASGADCRPLELLPSRICLRL